MQWTRKALVLLVIGGGLVFADLWTKDWAEIHLATPSHPIAVVIDSENQGQPLGEVLEHRLGPLTDATRKALFTEGLLRLDEEGHKKPSDPVYRRGSPISSRLYVFAHGDTSRNPRLVIPSEHRSLRRWLRLQYPEASPPEISRMVTEELEGQNVTQVIAEHVPFLDVESMSDAVKGAVWGLSSNPRKMRVGDSWENFQEDAPVSAGDIYLVTLHRIPVIEGFLRYSYAENPGAAWGFLATAEPQFRQIFFMSVTAFVGLVLLIFLIRLPPGNMLHLITFATILGGAVGNLVDRIRYRYVVDFIDMYIGDSHWPTYNVADIAITVGLGLLILDMVLNGQESLLLSNEPGKDPTDTPA